MEKEIQSGDLIAITTSMSNLDVVHTGFAIEKNGRIHLLHASSKNQEVEISEKPLSDYLAGNKSQSGIMVARLVAP
ncbi:N-acetylmuramoyl-L-alanine amidase-like domain-containing protein [Algoriphagus halophilus]|uniref:N-acetylmuramoyl-L-alanine amidase-like domain-containing protein n=1 Tax=Algoriphagus halophilus TaxID=226505 RepID=UPI00358FC77C